MLPYITVKELPYLVQCQHVHLLIQCQHVCVLVIVKWLVGILDLKIRNLISGQRAVIFKITRQCK